MRPEFGTVRGSRREDRRGAGLRPLDLHDHGPDAPIPDERVSLTEISDWCTRAESKDDLRSRIGRSTDTGDAMVYAAWGRLLGIRAVTNPRTHRGPAGITDDLLTKAM